jgi:antitoxin component YwqK of YwqJK toxin-antitoxin module
MCCICQHVDTIYFDKHWNESTSNLYEYYGIVRQDSGMVRVFSYNKSGVIQSKEGFKKNDFKEKSGPSYYYNKNKLYAIEVYEPSKYPEILSRYKIIVDNIPVQPDSLKLRINYYKNTALSSIGYISECCYYYGIWYFFTKHGKPSKMITYDHDKRNGPYIWYDKDGIYLSGSYVNDEKDGEWKKYDSGKLISTRLYHNGKFIRKLKN